MRAVLVLVVMGCAVGCSGVAGPLPDDGYGSGWMDPSGPPRGFGCHQDNECASSEVCARGAGCTAADQVRAVHVNWTVHGQPASTTTCSPSPDLRIQFSADNFEVLGYAPVPCRQGKFTIDKLPKAYDTVFLMAGIQNEPGVMLDAVTGEVTIDLAL